jgi:hypothetical protein
MSACKKGKSQRRMVGFFLPQKFYQDPMGEKNLDRINNPIVFSWVINPM